MNKKQILLTIITILPSILIAQCWMDKNIETLSKYIETDSIDIKFNVARDLEKEPNYKVHTAYYWYNKEIKCTFGGSSGKLLHGIYQEFYEDKQLAKKGSFYLGERKGNWKYWHANGRVKRIESYKKGVLHSWTKEYDEEGTLTLKSQYKRGVLDGKQIHYKNGEKEKTLIYKNGEQVETSIELEEKQENAKQEATKKNQENKKNCKEKCLIKRLFAKKDKTKKKDLEKVQENKNEKKN